MCSASYGQEQEKREARGARREALFEAIQKVPKVNQKNVSQRPVTGGCYMQLLSLHTEKRKVFHDFEAIK